MASRFSAVLNELNSAKARLAALEQQQEEQAAQLRALPQKFGYKNLNDFIRALRENASEYGYSTTHIKPAEPARGMMRATLETEASQPVASANASTTNDAQPVVKLPVGTSLDDPSNFGVMPDNTLLDLAAGDVLNHREQLTRSLEFARNVLHTSKVPAAVWREWRNFERRGVELLKSELPTPIAV